MGTEIIVALAKLFIFTVAFGVIMAVVGNMEGVSEGLTELQNVMDIDLLYR